MSRREQFIIIPALIIFSLHGLLYYAFPDQNYASGGNGGWISYIKYLCILLALPSLISYRFSSGAGVWTSTGIAFLLAPLPLYILWTTKSNILLFQYQLAVLGYFFAPFVAHTFSSPSLLRNSITGVLLISLAATTSEFLVGGIFGIFSRSGFRGVGPFVNPNNTGIVVALLAAYYHCTFPGAWKNIFIAFISIAILLMTGSKTAILIYSIGAFIAMPNTWRVLIAVVIPFFGYLNLDALETVFKLMSLRDFSLESGAVRSNDAGQVLGILGNLPLTDLLFGFSNESLVDNTYLDIICYGGLYLLSFFLLAQLASVYICIRNGRSKLALMHGLILLSMLTTNVPRLWPTGYVFWMMVGMSTYNPERQKRFQLKV